MTQIIMAIVMNSCFHALRIYRDIRNTLSHAKLIEQFNISEYIC